MVRAPSWVGTLSTTLNFAGESSWTTVTFTAGSEGQPGSGIKGIRIDAVAYWSGSHNFPRVSVNHRHHLVIATGKQATVLAVDGQATWLPAWRQGPACLDLQFAGIDGVNPALVFDIHEDLTLAIADRKLRLAFQLDRAHNRATGSVDGSSIVTPAVEGKNAFARGVVKNRIRILSGLDLGDGFQCFQVKDRDRPLPAVADKAASQIRSQRDAMHARRIRNISHRLARVGINHNHVRGAGDVESSRSAVHGQIVPATVAAELIGVDELIARVGGHRESRSENHKQRGKPERRTGHVEGLASWRFCQAAILTPDSRSLKNL